MLSHLLISDVIFILCKLLFSFYLSQGIKSRSEEISEGVQSHFGFCLTELLQGRLAAVLNA